MIFDKDGVLLNSSTDSLEWMDRLRIKEAAKKGADMTMDQSKAVFRADSAGEIRRIASETGLEMKELAEIERQVARAKMEKIKNGELGLFPSTEQVLRAIQEPKSVVSNAPLEVTEFTLDHCGIQRYFNAVLSPSLEDLERYAERKKPSPEMVHEAIESTGSENPVFIGDSAEDIIAAENAGIDSIHVRTNGGIEPEPTYTVEGIEEVLQVLEDAS